MIGWDEFLSILSHHDMEIVPCERILSVKGHVRTPSSDSQCDPDVCRLDDSIERSPGRLTGLRVAVKIDTGVENGENECLECSLKAYHSLDQHIRTRKKRFLLFVRQNVSTGSN